MVKQKDKTSPVPNDDGAATPAQRYYTIEQNSHTRKTTLFTAIPILRETRENPKVSPKVSHEGDRIFPDTNL